MEKLDKFGKFVWDMFLIIALILVIVGAWQTAFGLSYDVDMPRSPDPKSDMVCIKIESCETCKMIPKDKLEQFNSSNSERSQLVAEAIHHYKNGCGN